MGFMMRKILLFLSSVLLFSFSFAQEYKQFYEYLIDLDGWKGSQPSGQYTKTFMGELLKVERNYTKQNQSLKVQIIKGGIVMMMWMPFSMVVEQDTPEKFLKTTQIEGFKSAIEHNKKDNSGKILMMVAPNAAFILEYSGIKDYNQAVEIVKKFPLKKISMKLM